MNNGADVAVAYLNSTCVDCKLDDGDDPSTGIIIPESVKCTLLRKLFRYCSYCSKYIGTGPRFYGFMQDYGVRCARCGWIYCQDCCCCHEDDVAGEGGTTGKEDGSLLLCNACKDTDRWVSRPFETRNKITLGKLHPAFYFALLFFFPPIFLPIFPSCLSDGPTLIHSTRIHTLYHIGISTVYVIGSGIGGLAVALSLKNRGIQHVTVIEKYPQLRTSGGFITIQTNTMRSLLDISPVVFAQIYDHGGPLNGNGHYSTVNEPEKPLLVANLSTRKESRWGNPEGRSISRGLIQQYLYDECCKQGVQFVFHTKVVTVTEEGDDEKVTITATTIVSSGEDEKEQEQEKEVTYVGDFVIAADGIWSNVRTQIFPNLNTKPTYNGYQMINAIVPLEKFDNSKIDCWGERWGNSHRLGFFKCGKKDGTALYYSRTITNPDEDKSKTKDELKTLLVESLVKNGYDDTIVELGKAADPNRMYVYTIRHLPTPLQHHISSSSSPSPSESSSYKYGRILLLGDAAHGMPPNLGQGAGMGIESASILAQCMLSCESYQDAMSNYEARRVNRTTLVAKESKTTGDLFQASNFITVWLRNTLFAYVGKESTKVDMNDLEYDDTFAYLFNYRLLSWKHHK